MQRNVLVCVTQQKASKKLVEVGADLSNDKDSFLYVLHVVNENDKLLYNLSDGEALEYLFEITKGVGANLVVKRSKDPIKEIVDFAMEEEITHIVIGSSKGKNEANNFASKLQRRLPHVEIVIGA